MGDALQERIARMAQGPQRRATASEQVLHESVRREWYRIDGELVFFCPPLAITEIRESFPAYRGKRMEVA